MYQWYHITPFTFWDMHMGDMKNVSFKHTEIIEYVNS